MEFIFEKVTTDKRQLLYRLLQYSLFEESAFDMNEMNDEGEFDYPDFLDYFEEDHFAYFIKEQESHQLLGFVMGSHDGEYFDGGHCMKEMMILPRFRRHKLGKKVALALFQMYPGNWEISPSFGSETAFKFWNHVVSHFYQRHYDEKLHLFLINTEDDRYD